VPTGEAFIFSGKPSDHAGGAPGLLKTFNIPAADRAPTPCSSSCGSLGIAVQGIGDVTNDGVTDQLVDAGGFSYDVNTKGVCANQAAPSCNKSQGAEYVFNGATGAFIRRTDDPAPQAGATFGFQDAEPLAPGDVNGDGKADYYANGFGQDGPPPANLPSAGRGWVFDGGSGKLLYEILDPTPTEGGQFAFSLARTDYNKDGTPDLYAGQSPHEVGDSGLIQSGGTYIFDGKDGSLLKTLELPPSDAESGRTGNNGSNLGWTVAAPGDLNGDGEPDYVAGAPFQDVGPSALNCQAPDPGCAQDVGREYFFRSYVPPTPTSTTTTPTGTTTNTNTTTPSKTVVVAVTRKQPRLTSRVTKRRGHTKTTFHTTGRLLLPSGVSKARGCRGFVSVQIKHRTKTVSRRRATVRSNCTYSTTAAILNSRLRGRGRSEVVARFQGNTRLKAASASRKYI